MYLVCKIGKCNLSYYFWMFDIRLRWEINEVFKVFLYFVCKVMDLGRNDFFYFYDVCVLVFCVGDFF